MTAEWVSTCLNCATDEPCATRRVRLIFLRQRLRSFARPVSKELGHGVKSPILQRNECKGSECGRQIDRQAPEHLIFGGELQNDAGDH
jgi:hypothetical protein